MPKRRISRFSIENLLSDSTEKLRRGALLCFTEFLVSENFMDKMGREYQNFPSNIFFSHCRKFRKGPFSLTNLGYQKMLGINYKNIWHDRDSNPEPTASEPRCPNPAAVTYF